MHHYPSEIVQTENRRARIPSGDGSHSTAHKRLSNWISKYDFEG